MIDFASILKSNPSGTLATLDGKNIKTRVFQYLFVEENKVYFSTSNEKPVYKQLQAHPNTSFCAYSPDFAPVLSLNGEAIFVEDHALKVRALEENPNIRGIYGDANNPVFEIFYIDVKEVVTFDYTNGTKVYSI